MARALVLVNAEPNSTEKVFKEIKEKKEVKEAMQVYGEYDTAFVISAENTLGIQNFVKEIRKIKGLVRTVTLIEL